MLLSKFQNIQIQIINSNGNNHFLASSLKLFLSNSECFMFWSQLSGRLSILTQFCFDLLFVVAPRHGSNFFFCLLKKRQDGRWPWKDQACSLAGIAAISLFLSCKGIQVALCQICTARRPSNKVSRLVWGQAGIFCN